MLDLLSQFEDPIEVGEVAPDFTAPDLSGSNVTLILLEGNKDLLDFWAAWCRSESIQFKLDSKNTTKMDLMFLEFHLIEQKSSGEKAVEMIIYFGHKFQI